MNKVLKNMLTPPWLEKVLSGPEVPITEETVRKFIDIYWEFFGLDHGDPGKEALIEFFLEFGKERKEYNLKMVEPVMWAFINGFDEGFSAGHQKAWTTWERWAKENGICQR